MNKIDILSLDIFVHRDVKIVQSEMFVPIRNVKPITSADEQSLVFVVETADKEKLINETKARTVICGSIPGEPSTYRDKCLIVVGDPKLYFARLVNALLEQQIEPCIHPTAVIHPEARIALNVRIGAHTYIGKSEIGEGCVIHANVSIYDDIKMGRNVIVDSGAVIGSAGFGFVRDENQVPVPFPQLGGVVIGDYVEIGANTCIDRGALADTVIGEHTKIDNLVQIAHNDRIGKNNYIIGHCSIAGSVIIGDNCWIAAERILNKVTVGNNVFIGFGSQVFNSLKSDTTYMGSPAIEIKNYMKLQRMLMKERKNVK